MSSPEPRAEEDEMDEHYETSQDAEAPGGGLADSSVPDPTPEAPADSPGTPQAGAEDTSPGGAPGEEPPAPAEGGDSSPPPQEAEQPPVDPAPEAPAEGGAPEESPQEGAPAEGDPAPVEGQPAEGEGAVGDPAPQAEPQQADEAQQANEAPGVGDASHPAPAAVQDPEMGLRQHGEPVAGQTQAPMETPGNTAPAGDSADLPEEHQDTSGASEPDQIDTERPDIGTPEESPESD